MAKTTLKVVQYKVVNGKEVRPVMYVGSLVGKATYVAGSTDSGMVLDKAGNPVPYKMILPD